MKDLSDAQQNISQRARQKMVIGVNVGISLLLAALLFGMVNYLSFRHYYRADWSRSHFYSLSDKTQELLQSLTSRVEVIVFFQPGQAVYEDVDNLLKEYEYACKWISVERIDPDRNLARTEVLARKYQVSQANVIVFESHGRSKYVTADDVMEVDYSGVLQGMAPENKAFKGEQAFSSAIQSITQTRKPIVYFMYGHGERDVENTDQYEGFSTLKQQIQRDNVEVKTFTMGEQKSVPNDADALIVAGPQKKFSKVEMELLRAYLGKSGRMLFLLDTDTHVGVESLLEEWGVRVNDDVVVDPARTLTGLELYVNDYGFHPITKNLKEIVTVFYLPRSVEPLSTNSTGMAAQADKPQAVVLARSSKDGWAERDLDQKPLRYDANQDRKGPVSIAVAVEKGPVENLEVDIRPSRLVVMGDSDFAANGALTGGNVDFFLSSLNWLLEREELLAISPKPPDETRLVIDKAQLHMLFWAIVMGLPGLVATVGALVWLRRRA